MSMSTAVKLCIVVVVTAVLTSVTVAMIIVTNSSREEEPSGTQSISQVKMELEVDEKTKIVYIKNYVYGKTRMQYIYTPYYSENGYLCRYEDGKIIEIRPQQDKDGKNDRQQSAVLQKGM